MTTKPKTTQVGVRVDAEAVKQFDALAKEAGLDRSGYLQVWLGQIARIKRGNALIALTSIPSELLKGHPGRPTDEEAGKVT